MIQLSPKKLEIKKFDMEILCTQTKINLNHFQSKSEVFIGLVNAKSLLMHLSHSEYF